MKRTSSRLAGVVLLATMLLALVMPAAAKPVDAARAEQVARNFWNAHRDNGVVALSQPMQQLQLQWDGFYCFVSGEATGFVIVAADDCVQPVLGYSFHNPASAQPGPEVSYWLGYYQRQIDFMRAEGWMPSDAVQAEWRTLTESKAINPTPLTAVSPMLTTQWGQSPLYNNLCPDSSGVHAVVGCVATAMAQIMKYWNHPTMGTGSHSYTHPQFGTVSANFGNTTYAWNNMPNSLSSSSTTAQINAVATLSYHCGVAVEMDYGIGGSGAWTTNGTILSHACSQNAFVKYFGYSSHVEGRIHDDMTESAWSTAIRNELNAQRPVLFTGSDEGGGHAFVCDGYNNSNQYHFNWGWHGYYDGYFSLSNLDPEGGGTGSNNTNTFNYNQDILVGLQPATTANNDAGCVIRQFPYSANFDYGMPACWEVVNSQGDIYSWMRYEELGVNGSTCLFATASWNETATDAYLILPAIETPGTYALTYKVAAYNSNAPSYALYTTDNYPDIYESVTNTTFQTRTDTFVVAAGSSVNPMFRYISQNYGDYNSDYLLLDDVSIYQLSVDTTTSPLTNCVITSLPYVEDFEGDLPCLGVADGNGNDTIGWYRYNGWGYNGSKTLACQSFTDAYDLLYLPRIATPGNITFSWKARTYSPNYPEVYQVWLLTSSNSTLLYSETLSDTIYVSRSTGFTLAAGDTARIAIRTTSFDGGYLFLDDLAFNYATTTPQYTLTVISADESMGTVWGGGTFAAGSTTTIGATPYSGYIFDGWSDGILNNPRTVTVNSDATYWANFVEDVDYYYVDAVPNDATMGSVYGGGYYAEGTAVTLNAVANNGYHFVAWNDGYMDNPRTITVNGNITLIANFAADAQAGTVVSTFPWTEGFEGYDYPDGFTFVDADNDGFNWTMSQNYGSFRTHAGSGCITSASYNNDGVLYPDNWMILPAFALPANANNYELTWWVCAQDSSWAYEYYDVYITTSGNNVSNFTSSTSVYSGYSTGTYVKHTVSLANYAGQTIYVAFRHHNCSDMWFLNIDDIRVGAPAVSYTITAQSNNANWGSVYGSGVYEDGTRVTLSAVANHGYQFVQWNDGVTDNPRTITVTGNASYTATFAAVVCNAITSFPWEEDFESRVDCWNFVTADGGSNGMQLSTYYAHGGYYSLVGTWSDDYNVDQWAISPALTLPTNASNYILRWNVLGNIYEGIPCHYQVRISTTGTNTSDFTTVLYDAIDSVNSYKVRNVSLAAYAGQTVRIAIRNITPMGGDAIFFDDIYVGAGTVVSYADVNIACQGNGEVHHLYTDYNNLCGTTDQLQANASGVFYQSYDFIPGTGSSLTHLYVNNVDRINEVNTFNTSGLSVNRWAFSSSTNSAVSMVAVFSEPQVTYNTITAINDGGGYMYVYNEDETVGQFITAGTHTLSVPSNENAYVEFATFGSNFQYLSNLVSVGMNPNALTLEHIYLDGVEIPLTASNILYVEDEMSTEGYIIYKMILPAGSNANHTVRGVYSSDTTPTPDPCVIASLPYTQDFENGAECWTVQDYNGNDTTWGLTSGWGYNGSRAAYVGSYQDAGDLLFTPSFVVPGTHTLTFKARGYSAQYVEKFQVWDLYDTNAVLLITDSVADSNYHTYSVNFTIAQGDTHQLAFRSIWYSAYLFIDDVVISNGGTTPQYYTITAQSANPNIGYVTGGGQYVAGSTVTLTAVPYSGYRFASWGDGMTSNPRTITVYGNATYVAYFDVDNTTYNTLTATNDGGGYMRVYNEDETVDQFITAGTQTISIPSNDYVVVQLATFGSNFQDLSVLVNQLGMSPNALTLTHLYYDNVEISLTDTNQLYIFNEMSTEGYIMYILLVPGSANHTVRAVYGNGGTPQNVANVNFQCQGNGSVYRANTSVNNLCGQTDQVAYNQQQGGFMASYDFVPANGGTLTHLYVNNVDRINDVTNYTASGVSLSRWNFFSATNTALSVVPVFTSGSVTYNTLTVTNVGGGYMYIFNEDETIDEFIVTSTTQTISIASDDAAIVQLVTFNSNYPYLSDLINEGMNPNAMTLMHLYYDGVEIPLTSSNQNLQIYNNLSSNGYIVYNLTVPGSANHTVRAVYGSGSTPTPDPCVITSLPYTQDFENGAECWTVQDYNGNDTTWGLINSWGYNGSRAVYVGSYQDAGDLLFTPSFVVPGTHTLTFKARGYSAQYVEKFQVWDLYDTNAVLLITDSVADSNYHTYSVNFTIAQGDTHQLSFRSIWYSAYLFIDDVVISTGGTPQPTVANVTFQCQGNGQAYRAGNRNNSLCGQTDQVAYNQQQNAFMASYEFIPNNGSELTHLYVNNVDRVSETVTRYSGNSVIVSWNMRTQDSQVTVRPVFAVNCNNVEVTNNVTACDSYTWFGITYVESGVYTHVSYGAANGCDSIYHLNLTLGQSYIDTTHMRVRQQYTWEGQTYRQSGTFIKRYTTVLGCDSIRVLELTVDSTMPCDDVEAYLEMKACESYLWYGTTYVENGVYEHIEHGVVAGGCDSVYHLVLSIGHPTVDTVEAYLPEGGTYEFGGQTFNRTGTFILGGTNVYGCDSTVVLVLTNNNAIASPDANGVSLTVYPNPTRGEVTVSTSARIERVEVMDALGRMVRSTVPAENGTEMRLDMTALPAGTYMIRITTAEGTALQRLLKQ